MSNWVRFIARRAVAGRLLRALLLIPALGVPAAGLASSFAGIEVTAGNSFSVAIYYNTVVTYRSKTDKFVRDPSRLLFDVVAFVDANYDALSKLNKQIRIDLLQADSRDPEDVALMGEDGPAATGELRKVKAGKDLPDRVFEFLCGFVREQNCIRPRGVRQVPLYRCESESCPGGIKFGNIPSEERPKYSLRPENKNAPRFLVTRTNIRDRFKPLL